MAFQRSDFLLLYNIPSYVSEQMIASNIPKLEYVVFMPLLYDNMRCGFALVASSSSSRTEEVTKEVLHAIRSNSFMGQTIDVDEVWFRSVGNMMDPPNPELMKSNFIFVYNIPCINFSKTELFELTNSRNILFLPQSSSSRCAFVEAPELSELEWDQMLTKIRTSVIRGYKLLVDEIWLYPAPALSPVPIEENPRSMSYHFQPNYHHMEVERQDRRAMERAMEPRMSAEYSHVRGQSRGYDYNHGQPRDHGSYSRGYGLSKPPTPPSIFETSNRRTLLDRPYGDQAHLPPPLSPPPAALSASNSSNDPFARSEVITKLLHVLTARKHDELFASMVDGELKALSEVIAGNMMRLQSVNPRLEPQQLSIFYGNIQALHSEVSARNIIVERPEDVDAIGTVGHATSAITKMDLASLITFTMKRPATAASKEEEPVAKKPSSYAPPPVAPSPPPMQLPVTAAVAAVTKAPTKAEVKEEPAQEKTAVVESEAIPSNYIYINKIPKQWSLMQLLNEIPNVENFVFTEATDEQWKSGFAQLKSESEDKISEVSKAFYQKSGDLEVFKVSLELILDEANLEPVGVSAGTQTSKEDAEVKALPPDEHFPASNEIKFLKSTGVNDDKLPIFYCVEVSELPRSTTMSGIAKALKERVNSMHEYILLTNPNNRDRRALFFGGAYNEAEALMEKLKGLLHRLSDKLAFRVSLTNVPDTLAPVPPRVASEVKIRRIVLHNLPLWPVELLLMRIAKFAPKATSYIAPAFTDFNNGYSAGHIYLGYECHEDADADFHRLDGWRLEGSDNILVKFVVDTGWGSDAPLTGFLSSSLKATDHFLRYRKDFNPSPPKDKNTKDTLAKYKNGPPLPSDLHSVFSKMIYDGARENLYAMVIRRLPLHIDCSNFILRIVKSKLTGLEAAATISSHGDFREVVVFFGVRDSTAVDLACHKFRQMITTQSRDLQAVVPWHGPHSGFEVERHQGTTFVPVTKDFAIRRGCQFLIFSSLPSHLDKTGCLYDLRALCPAARSFYVPCLNSLDSNKVMGYAVARFTDPRQCRAAFLALAPTTTLAGATIRVAFAALHKVIPTTYQDRSYNVPLHVWFPWHRFDPENSSNTDPWVLDNTSKNPFFCSCHQAVLPFKPPQLKAVTCVMRKTK